MDRISSLFENVQGKLLGFAGSSSRTSSERLAPPQWKQLNDSLYEVHTPLGRPTVELVFFHGLELQGDPDIYFSTWSSKDGSDIWLNWIPTDISGARILTVSYHAPLWRSNEYADLDLYFTAENILFSLFQGDIGRSGSPVVLVGHSYGGFIIKELCVQAATLLNVGPYEEVVHNFWDNLKGIFFYATPHYGSQLADSNLGFVKGSLFEGLTTLNTQAARQNEAFRRLHKHYGWNTFGVGEKIPVKLGKFSGLIAEEASANSHADSYWTIDADHFNVCRPSSRTSVIYTLLVQFVTDILQKDEAQKAPDGPKTNFPDEVIGLEGQTMAVIEKLSENQRLCLVGMQGIGKSTLAEAVYNEIKERFDYTCFFVEASKYLAFEEHPDDLRSKIKRSLRSTEQGRNVHKNFKWSTLQGRKVLIVVDDVVSESQVMVMTESDKFLDESRIIVTTRDAGFLKAKKYFCHSVEKLDQEDSLRLFCLHAFLMANVPNEYKDQKDLINKIKESVEHCRGLPQNLKMAGRDFYRIRKVGSESQKEIGEQEMIRDLGRAIIGSEDNCGHPHPENVSAQSQDFYHSVTPTWPYDQAPQDAENETAWSGEDPEKQICQDQEDAGKSQVCAQEESKELEIMNEDHGAIALKGLVVADAKKLNVSDQHYESNSSVGKLHNHLGHGKQQDFVRDFIREINRGEGGFSVSKTWLFSLEEHEKETLLSVLGRTGYFEFYQTRTTIIYRRIENNGEVPTVYNYLVRTSETNDVFNGATKQLLASNDYGDSDEIEEKGYSTETQDGKELGSGSQTERSNIVDSDLSTVSSFENKIQLAMVQTNDTARLGSLRSLPDKGKTIFPGSNEKLESFKRALKDTGPYSYSVSTQWLSTLSDHEIEDVNIVLFKAGYSQIDKTSTTTYFKGPHDHVHNNPGHQSETSSTSERRTLVSDMERSNTFQGTEAIRAQKLLLDSDDTEVTSKIQARQRRKVDCGCLPQDMTVSCTPSSQGPVEPSTSSFQRGFSKHSTRDPVGNCYVTMPRKRKQVIMNTGADKTEVMGTVEFDAEKKPYVKPVTFNVSVETSLSCCLCKDGNNRKVRFEFLKIQGAVRMEDSMNLKTNTLVLRAVRANVVAYIINAKKAEISEVVNLRIIHDKECTWPIKLGSHQSIDENGKPRKVLWMGISPSDPINSECGSKSLDLRCRDIFWTDPEPESCNHELLFSDHDWRVMVEGDFRTHLDQNSFLELNLRYQLEYSLDEAVDPLPKIILI